MNTEIIIPGQLWLIRDFLSHDKYTFVRNLYRKAENNRLKMLYDNRLLSDWSETTELNALCDSFTQQFIGLTETIVQPQVGYVSIELPHAHVMMHRIHTDIKIQVQIPLCTKSTESNSYAFCLAEDVNNTNSDDHQPYRAIQSEECVFVPHVPGSAIVYLNNPRIFNGMMNKIPENSVRETLWLNYQ
jgi:hypothetical protein